MEHRVIEAFWRAYEALPQEMLSRADKTVRLLKSNPQHPSLQSRKLAILAATRLGRRGSRWAIAHWRPGKVDFSGFGSEITEHMTRW